MIPADKTTSVASDLSRPCPVCGSTTLTAPGQCSVCGVIRLFEVKQSRIIRATYKRQIWARDEAHAVRIVGQGTSWPESYDEHRESVECGEFAAVDVTATGYLRTDGGYGEDD